MTISKKPYKLSFLWFLFKCQLSVLVFKYKNTTDNRISVVCSVFFSCCTLNDEVWKRRGSYSVMKVSIACSMSFTVLKQNASIFCSFPERLEYSPFKWFPPIAYKRSFIPARTWIARFVFISCFLAHTSIIGS